MSKKKIVVLTGAGISAESGIPTFRDAVDGLWENYNVDDVCTAEAIENDPQLVHTFYNELRERYRNAEPNDAHKLLKELENDYDVTIITQNVDNLHEQAGSKDVLHLHGEMMKCRAVDDLTLIYDIPEDEDGKYTTQPDMEIEGHKVRPHIVFFGEGVPNIVKAGQYMANADIVVVIGTSLQVYPAAGLLECCQDDAQIFYIDPKPTMNPLYSMYTNFQIIPEVATKGMKILLTKLKNAF